MHAYAHSNSNCVQITQQAVVPTQSGKFKRVGDVWGPEVGKGWSLPRILADIPKVDFVEAKAYHALCSALSHFPLQVGGSPLVHSKTGIPCWGTLSFYSVHESKCFRGPLNGAKWPAVLCME